MTSFSFGYQQVFSNMGFPDGTGSLKVLSCRVSELDLGARTHILGLFLWSENVCGHIIPWTECHIIPWTALSSRVISFCSNSGVSAAEATTAGQMQNTSSRGNLLGKSGIRSDSLTWKWMAWSLRRLLSFTNRGFVHVAHVFCVRGFRVYFHS